MSLNYHIQELPKMRGEEQLTFPKLETYSVFDNKKMVERIALESGLQEGAVMAVLNALPKSLKNIMLEGHTCKLDGFGTFSFSLTFDENNEVVINKLNLKVDTNFMEELRKEASFVMSQQDIVAIKASKGCLDEHAALAMKWLETHPFITLQEYANLIEMSLSTASRELRAICKNPNYGITSKGERPHKVWVKL